VPETPKHALPTVSSSHGQQILSSYTGSYALLIGQSQYTKEWSNLESIPGELAQVEEVLIKQGFKVEKSLNLNADQLRTRFKTFINDYGFDEDNRLLFFYSGHGYTRKDKGYIVPTDAPNPDFDEKGFLRKAVTMSEILAMARRMEAKHALFLFDSCFSGTVFKAKNLPKIQRQISQAANLPVRQFITAGSANETVPAESAFALAFVDALRYEWGDMNKDGYVTGQELGLYLWNTLPNYTEQTPQYGKIRDYKLSRGDFVFAVGKKAPVQVSNNTTYSDVFKTGKNFAINFARKVWDDFDRDCLNMDSLLERVSIKLDEQKELLKYQNVGDSEKEFNRGYSEGSVQILEAVLDHCTNECSKIGIFVGEQNAFIFCEVSKAIGKTASFGGMVDIPNMGCGEPYRVSCESTFYSEAKKMCPSYAKGHNFKRYYRASFKGCCSYNQNP